MCVLALATVVLSACTDDVTPSPPVTTEPTTTSETPRPTVAPAIEVPIDLTPHHRQACALLTPTQTTELRFPPKATNGANDETGLCQWNSVPSGDAIYAITVYMTGDPLGLAYQHSSDRLDAGGLVWEPFEIRTIEGLPAVVKVMGDPSTYCEVVIGAGGGQGILLTASISPELADPVLCDRMVTAAAWVVTAARS